MVKKFFGVAVSSQKAEKSGKMPNFSVPPKISDSRNAKIMFLTVKYVRYMYRILFGGSKLTENTEEKCENVSPHNRPVRSIPDRSIIIPDRTISFRNMGPVRRI